MNYLLYTEALGWTLLHSLWQGAALAFLYLLARFLLRNHSPQLRYLLALTTLTALPVCAGITLVQYWPEEVAVTEMAQIPIENWDNLWSNSVIQSEAQSATLTWQDQMERALPYLSLVWLMGVGLMWLRWCGGLWNLYQMRHAGTEAGPAKWQNSITQWAQNWGINRPVKLLISNRISSPATLGFWKPIILIPATVVTGLSPEQWEAILLHELAHIRRADYAIRMIQSLIEILFFYHPLVWWVGRDLAHEREACCDDQAVAVCGDALRYAQALTTLQRMCQPSNNQLAMAIQSKHTSSFTRRIQRLFEPTTTSNRPKAALILAFMLLVSLTSYAWMNMETLSPTTENQQVSIPNTVEPSVAALPDASEHSQVSSTDLIAPYREFQLTIDTTWTPEYLSQTITKLREQGITLYVEKKMFNCFDHLIYLSGQISFPSGVQGEFGGQLGRIMIRKTDEELKVMGTSTPVGAICYSFDEEDPMAMVVEERPDGKRHVETIDSIKYYRVDGTKMSVEAYQALGLKEEDIAGATFIGPRTDANGTVIESGTVVEVVTKSRIASPPPPPVHPFWTFTLGPKTTLDELTALTKALEKDGYSLTVRSISANDEMYLRGLDFSIEIVGEDMKGKGKVVSSNEIDPTHYALVKLNPLEGTISVTIHEVGSGPGQMALTGISIRQQEPTGEPIYILNGEVVDRTVLQELEPSQIERIDVLKGESAAELGLTEDTSNGVIEITTKSGEVIVEGKPTETPEPVSIRNIEQEALPLVIIDGEEVPNDELDELLPEQIEHVEVIKGDCAVEEYGEKGENGVVLIQTKQPDQLVIEPITLKVSPNPSDDEFAIEYSLDQTQQISIGVYDLQGRLIEEIFSGTETDGNIMVIWSGRNLPDGTYLIKLTGESVAGQARVQLLR